MTDSECSIKLLYSVYKFNYVDYSFVRLLFLTLCSKFIDQRPIISTGQQRCKETDKNVGNVVKLSHINAFLINHICNFKNHYTNVHILFACNEMLKICNKGPVINYGVWGHDFVDIITHLLNDTIIAWPLTYKNIPKCHDPPPIS